MHTLKRFIQYYAPYKAVFFLDLVCAAIISLVDLAFPQILRTLTRTLFVENASSIMRNLVPIGIVLFLIYVLQACCKYYVSYQGHMMGAHMERDMRQQLFDHYEKLSFSYYDQNNSGQMMSKLVSDLFDIAEFAHHGPENLFISLIKIIGSFVFLFLINWKLAIPLLVMVVFMIFFSGSQNRKMQTTFMDNRQKIGNVNSSLQDTLAGIRVVQSFANEEIEREKFMESNHGFLLSKKANYQCMGSFMSGNLFFQGMMYLITLVFGGWLIAHGQMEVADLAMYALYIGIFISPIQILVELTEMMQKGLSGFRRFLDVVETEPEITNAPDAELLDDVKGDVNYENVFFHYSDDDTPVLENVSFHIPAGKSIALVGPSGEGKTTMIADSSTTVMEALKLLPQSPDITVVTNSTEVFREFQQSPLNIISTGGEYNKKSLSLQGQLAKTNILKYNVSLALISCKGLSIEKGVLDSNESEAEVKKAMLSQAEEVALLVDFSKFDQSAFVNLIDLQKVNYIITDRSPSEKWIEYCSEQGIELIY